jgi:hypothetical protein
MCDVVLWRERSEFDRAVVTDARFDPDTEFANQCNWNGRCERVNGRIVVAARSLLKNYIALIVVLMYQLSNLLQ